MDKKNIYNITLYNILQYDINYRFYNFFLICIHNKFNACNEKQLIVKCVFPFKGSVKKIIYI